MHSLGFSDKSSLDEVVPFQKLVRKLIILSLCVGDGKISIIPMGIPAQTVVDGVLQNLGKWHHRMSKHRYLCSQSKKLVVGCNCLRGKIAHVSHGR